MLKSFFPSKLSIGNYKYKIYRNFCVKLNFYNKRNAEYLFISELWGYIDIEFIVFNLISTIALVTKR